MTSVPHEISNFFLAMQAGAPGGSTMEQLFADDAVYEEPFSGSMKTHAGRGAIIETMKQGWAYNPADIHIAIDRAEANGDAVVIDWTCYSSALPGGVGRGTNRFTMRGGKIARLVTTLK